MPLASAEQCAQLPLPVLQLASLVAGGVAAGGDRPQLYRYGLGSLREVNGILLAAVAFGWLAEAPLAAERDRLGAILFGLQRG
jgi:hypothetical protein